MGGRGWEARKISKSTIIITMSSSSSTLISSIINWFRNIFFSKELEVCIVGLQVGGLFFSSLPLAHRAEIGHLKASGKTSLVNVLANGQYSEEVVPTVRPLSCSCKVWTRLMAG